MLIKDVFEQFLAEQQSQLAPKTYRDYASVLELFEHQLEGYAWNNLTHGQKAYETAKKKGKSFIELYDLKFCKVRWMAYREGYPSAHAAPSKPDGGGLYANHCGLSDRCE